MKFVEDTVKKVKAKGHKKIAFVLDNASYHNEYRADIPRPGWAIDRIKDFCKLHDLEVKAVHGKKGKPVKQLHGCSQHLRRTRRLQIQVRRSS